MRYILAFIVVLVVFSGCAGVNIKRMGTDMNYAQLQISKGIPVDTKNPWGSTPLHEATYNGKLPVAKYLIENGANVNQKGYNGNTPLLFAASEGYLAIVKYLIDQGADVNRVNRWQAIPIHYAAQAGHLEVVKYLVSKGSSLIHKDTDKYKTPLQWAQRKNKTSVATYLENLSKPDYGAYLSVKNKDNFDAYKSFMKNYPNSSFRPQVQSLIAEKVQKLLGDTKAMKKVSKKVLGYLKAKDINKIIHYTHENELANAYVEHHGQLYLLLVGPKAFPVGRILQYKKEGHGESILVAKIKGQKAPYKDFTFDEINIMKKMGLTDNLLGAMIEATNKYEEKLETQKSQEAYLAKQQKIKNQEVKTKTVYRNQSGGQKSNGIIDKVGDKIIDKAVGKLFDSFF